MKLQKCFYFFHDLPYYLLYLSKNELTKTFLFNNYNSPGNDLPELVFISHNLNPKCCAEKFL